MFDLGEFPSAATSVLGRFPGFHPAVRPPSFDLQDAATFFFELNKFQHATFAKLRLSYQDSGEDSFCKLLAVKLANAFAADYHFRNRHSVLVSRPLQLQMDPTNACNLSCPSCLHTTNTSWGSRFDWPAATLRPGEFSEFCNQFGPFATSIALFRDGEPLLHRRFPEFVTMAKNYLLRTLASTNLSMPFDADALVASGLDRLVAAIDGGSAGTYARYRRGGDFDLVLDNLRAIVRARREQSSLKPWLVWEFLAFEHNVHEIESAATLAREIGVDQFSVARPHAVEHDDPSIKAAAFAPTGETLFRQPTNWCTTRERRAAARNAERIDAVFHQSWTARFAACSALGPETRVRDQTCVYLYSGLTMDAARRITPCCLPPMGPPDPRHLVYARFNGKDAGEVFNSLDFRRARSGGEPDNGLHNPAPYCVTCAESQKPPMPLDVAGYLMSVDERRALPPAVHAALAARPLFAWTP
jgi:molybdenum cofactor biosynthesis enzyme MoaA